MMSPHSWLLPAWVLRGCCWLRSGERSLRRACSARLHCSRTCVHTCSVGRDGKVTGQQKIKEGSWVQHHVCHARRLHSPMQTAEVAPAHTRPVCPFTVAEGLKHQLTKHPTRGSDAGAAHATSSKLEAPRRGGQKWPYPLTEQPLGYQAERLLPQAAEGEGSLQSPGPCL